MTVTTVGLPGAPGEPHSAPEPAGLVPGMQDQIDRLRRLLAEVQRVLGRAS